MQPEGPNKSEERLQRYAKERRAQGGDFSLHPATRRLLQGEVARQFGARTKEERTWLTWFSLWRGRLAVSTAFAVVLVVGTWVFWNGQSAKHESMKLADARTSGREQDLMKRADDSELQPESTRSIAAVAPAVPLATAPVNQPVTLRENLTRDGVAQNGVQFGAKVNMDSLAVAENPRPSTANYFADFAFISPATNASAQTWSRPLAENLWAFQMSPTSDVQANLSSLTDTGVVLAAPFGSSQAGGVPAGAAGRTLYSANTNSALADNTSRFYRLSEAQVALRRERETDEAKRALQVNELAKKPLDAGVALSLKPEVGETLARAEAPALVVAAPAVPAQNVGQSTATFANTSVTGTSVAQQSAGDTAGLGIRNASARSDAGGGQVVFYNQLVTAVSSEDEALRARQLQNLAAKKAEQLKEESQVLSEFTVEQVGNSVRLYDADGSVYAGEVVAVAEPESRAKLQVFKEDSRQDKDAFGRNQERAKDAPAREANANRGEEFSFNAVGNNVRLQQRVEVNGRFTRNTDTNTTALTVTTRGTAGGAIAAPAQKALTPAPAAPAPTRRSLQRFAGAGVVTNPAIAIEGTLQIGATNVQRFRAVPGVR